MGLQVFAAIVDEFGSTLNTTDEISCMASIISYMNVGNTGKHAPFTSWYYWCDLQAICLSAVSSILFLLP